ncbi:MAG: MEDS domain-containing protein, partial [Candidatus Hadarchaeum sp.]|uniref:MEDS domain-containing protein n=1 Tax=Candidatus Hadarchaeum sp. TaxID=2883567 RepID=UPI003D0BB9CE
MGPGEHLACVYRGKRERDAAVVSFLLAGLENNEKCLLVMDESTREDIVQAFQRAGAAVEKYLKSGQLELLRVEDTYLKDGYFDPDRTVAMIGQAVEAAIREGYRGLRGAAEASWSLRKLPGSERQLEYEAKINRLLPQSQVTALCLYDERKFSPKVLLDVIYTHPKIILHNTVCENPSYIRPEDLATREKGEVARAVYQRVKENIFEAKLREEELDLSRELMRRNQELHQLMINRMPIGMILWDRDFRVRMWN